MQITNELPAPSWQGFDPQAVEKFAAFVSRTNRLGEEIQRVKKELSTKQGLSTSLLATLHRYQRLLSIAEKLYVANGGPDTLPEMADYRRALQSIIDASSTPALIFAEATRIDSPIVNKLVHRSHIQDIIDHAGNKVAKLKHDLSGLRSKVRHLNAELANLIKLSELKNRGVDDDEIVAVVAYISHLPGVMGLKFDGDGIPVIHIRATHAIGGKQWDFGDYEFTLKPNTEYMGVLELTKTRGVLGYWDQGDWFCFGDRSPLLNQLFNIGNYADLLQLMINTLNGVNEGYTTPQLDARYEQIPPGAVWTTSDEQE